MDISLDTPASVRTFFSGMIAGNPSRRDSSAVDARDGQLERSGTFVSAFGLVPASYEFGRDGNVVGAAFEGYVYRRAPLSEDSIYSNR